MTKTINMNTEMIYKVTKTLPLPSNKDITTPNKDTISKTEENKELIYLPCIRLLELYQDCLDKKEDNCESISGIIIGKCSV